MHASDVSGDRFAREFEDRSVRVFRRDGAPDGPRIATGFRAWSGRLALDAPLGLIWIAQFESGAVKCFDWRTGEPKCAPRHSYPKLNHLCTLGGHRLLIEQTSARASTGSVSIIESATGEELERLDGVCGSHALGDSPWIVLSRGGRFEFRRSLKGEAEWAFATGTTEFGAYVEADTAVVTQVGGLVKCFDLRRGTECWRFDCGEGWTCRGAIIPRDHGVVVGTLAHIDVGGFGEVLVLDRDTGKVVKREPLTRAIGVPIDHGRAAVSFEGCTTLPDMGWTPHNRAIE